MTIEDVLNGQTSPAEDQTPNAEILAELVGEGRKYKSVEDLAKSRIEADKFIDQLKGELKTVRTEFDRLADERKNSKTIEDVLKALESPRPREGVSGDNQSASQSPGDLEKLVEGVLTRKQSETQAKLNRDTVNKQVLEAFGMDQTKAREFVSQTLSQSGVSNEVFQNLVNAAPQAALKLLGVESKATDTETLNQRNKDRNVSPTARADLQSFAPITSGVRNKTYYNNLKKQMGFNKFFGDIKLQQAMIQDAANLGDSFYT